MIARATGRTENGAARIALENKMVAFEKIQIEDVVVVPANQPGWQVAIHLQAENNYASKFVYEDILAWRFDKAINVNRDPFVHSPIPITVEGEYGENVSNLWCIKSPEGIYYRQADATYSTEEEALRALDSEIAREKQRKKKEA